MKILLEIQRVVSIPQSREDTARQRIKLFPNRGKRRLQARLEDALKHKKSDRPISRSVQKLANRYSVIQNKEIG